MSKTTWALDLAGNPFIEMCYVPEGKFVMGSDSSVYEDEKPQREVFLSGYYIAKYPVTNRQFQHFMEETGYKVDHEMFLHHWNTGTDGKKTPPEELLDHPVVYVNWMDAVAFCKAYGLHLPSEAQWEKAARGTDQRTYSWGNEQPDRNKPQCNFGGIFNGTTPVGTFDGTHKRYEGIEIGKGTSPYGAEDMCGNVWEWCSDKWDSEWLKNMPVDQELGVPLDPCNVDKKNAIHPTKEQVFGALGIVEGVGPLIARKGEKEVPFSETPTGRLKVGHGQLQSGARGLRTAPITNSTASTNSSVLEHGEVEVKEDSVEKDPFNQELSGQRRVVPGGLNTYEQQTDPIMSRFTTTATLVFDQREDEQENPFNQVRTGSHAGAVVTASPDSAGQRTAAASPPASATTALGFAQQEVEEEKAPLSEIPSGWNVEVPGPAGTCLQEPRSATMVSCATISTILVSEQRGDEQGDPFNQVRSELLVGAVGTTASATVGQCAAAIPAPATAISTLVLGQEDKDGEEEVPLGGHGKDFVAEVGEIYTIPELDKPCNATTLVQEDIINLSDFVQENEKVKEDPFSKCDVAGYGVSCSSIGVLPIETGTSLTAGSNSLGCAVAEEDKKEEENPFPECHVVGHGTALSTTCVSSVILETISTVGTNTLGCDVVEEDKVEEEEHPLEECIGSFVGEVGSVLAEEIVEQRSDTALLLATVTPTLDSTLVLGQQEDEDKQESPLGQDCSNFCVEEVGVTPLSSVGQHSVTLTKLEAAMVALDSDQQGGDVEEENPFVEGCEVDHMEPITGFYGPQPDTTLNAVTEVAILDSVQQEDEDKQEAPFSEGCAAGRGSTTSATCVPPIASGTIPPSGSTTTGCAVASERGVENSVPFGQVCVGSYVVGEVGMAEPELTGLRLATDMSPALATTHLDSVQQGDEVKEKDPLGCYGVDRGMTLLNSCVLSHTMDSIQPSETMTLECAVAEDKQENPFSELGVEEDGVGFPFIVEQQPISVPDPKVVAECLVSELEVKEESPFECCMVDRGSSIPQMPCRSLDSLDLIVSLEVAVLDSDVVEVEQENPFEDKKSEDQELVVDGDKIKSPLEQDYVEDYGLKSSSLFASQIVMDSSLGLEEIILDLDVVEAKEADPFFEDYEEDHGSTIKDICLPLIVPDSIVSGEKLITTLTILDSDVVEAKEEDPFYKNYVVEHGLSMLNC